MFKKTLIVGLILCSFLIASVSTVIAADEEKSFTDPPDDVLDIDGNDVSTKPNIDVINITYTKKAKEVALKLIVKGNIENRGDLGIIENMDYDEEYSFDLVYYAISLYSLEHSYDILYINKKCNFTIDSEEVGKLTSFSYVDSTLEFIFDLKDQDEKYTGLTVETADMSSLEESYMDSFMDFAEQLDVTINAPDTGKVGQSITFSATVSGGDSYEYEWYFDEDLDVDSTVERPIYTYDEAGTYNVTLLVYDSEGKQGYDYLTITISEDETNNGGNNNNNQGRSDNAILLFAAIIVIIVIIGVAVVVLIIRR